MNIRSLKNPPIAEVVVLVVPLMESEANVEQLKEISNLLSSRFPVIEEKRTKSVAVRIHDGKPAFFEDEKCNGFEVYDKQRQAVIQLSLDRLIISRLPPYTNGDELIEMCNYIISVYLSVLKPTGIKKFDLRYINKMLIWSEYIEQHIKIKPALQVNERSINHHKNITKFHLSDADNGIGAVVNFAVSTHDVNEKETDRGIRLEVILDIDVFKRDIKISPEWNVGDELHKLRSFKNDIFFSNINESLLKEFE